jgi:uncharacterized membrane protein
VRQAERYKWAVTRGVNEGELLEGLPEGLHKEIRRELILRYSDNQNQDEEVSACILNSNMLTGIR